MGGEGFIQGDSQSIHAVCVVDPDETVIPPYILDNVQNTTASFVSIPGKSDA